MWKKILTILFVAILLTNVFAAGCAPKDNDALAEALLENQDLSSRISELESQLNAAGETIVPSPTASPAKDFAVGVNALLYPVGGSPEDAAPVVFFDDQISVVAIPIVPEGMVIDCWKYNNDPIDNASESASFQVKDGYTIEAVLREERKVTSINATMQFLDEKGKPTGNPFEEYIFEEDDENVKDGRITVFVEAEVPANHYVSHWLINNIPYHFNRTVNSFTVYDLNEATVYEPVFKKLNPTPTPTPTTTPVPVETVTISCTNCTFSGGGYTNATSGTVPKGTSVTVTGTTALGNPVIWLINGETIEATLGMSSITRTVNSNTTFRYTGFN